VDRVSYEDSAANGVNVVAANEMRAAMRARFRLRPDRRFLLAIADAHHTLTGERLSVVRVRRRDGKWMVSYKNREVGPIPDVPTYETNQALMDGWVSAVAKDRQIKSASDSTAATINRLIVDYTPERLFEALRLIDRRWSTPATRDPALLAAAARALVGLVMQGVDRAESADVLAARALAYVSLARTLSGDSVSDADALLAWLLGYHDASAKLASTLPPDHPIRQLVTGDLGALARSATDSTSPRLVKLAHLRALATAHRNEDWKNAVATLHVDLTRDPEAAATGLLLDEFVLSASLPPLIEKGVMARLAPATRVAATGAVRVRLASYTAGQSTEDDGEPAPAQSLPQLGARTRELAATLVGPALDTAVFETFHRGLLHSAYLSYGLFHLELRSDYPAAVAFSHRFEGLDSTTADGELGAWYARLSNVYATSGDRMALIDDLARFRSLSGQVLSHTFDAMSERVKPFDPRRARMVRLLSERLDTRPSQRAQYAFVARDDLLDPVIVAQLYGTGSATLARENPAMAVWLATAYHDTVMLRAIVNDSAAGAWARWSALSHLADDAHLPVDEQKQHLTRIIADDPSDWSARDRYIGLLRTNHEFGAAEQEARNYIQLGRADDGFDLIAAHVSIGNTLIAQGRYAEASAALRPVIETYQAGAMSTGVRAFARAGRLTQAAALADRLAERYPESEYAHAARLEVLWRQGNHSAVAKDLREHEWLAGETAVAKAFVEVFGASGDQAAARAALSLAQEGAPPLVLFNMGYMVHYAGRDDLAFELASRGIDPNPMAAVFQNIAASRFLATSRGQDEALEWLRQRLPMPFGDEMSFFLADVGHDEVLWAWTPDENNDAGRFTWLMRALVAVRSGLDTSSHRQQLLDHYSVSSQNPYHVMGRYLVGLEHEDAMLALATTLHRKCEVSFYLGARARADGRIADAVDWFRVAVETAQQRDGEYYWAIRALSEISSDPRGLSVPSAVPGLP